MIKAFETGKWYRYTGKRRKSDWNHDGEMDFCLDGAPHKCTLGEGYYAKFEDSGAPGRSWNWDDDLGQWFEAPEVEIWPSTLKSLEKEQRVAISKAEAIGKEIDRLKKEQAAAPKDKEALAEYLVKIGKIEAPALTAPGVKALLVGIQEKIKEARAATATSKPKKKA